MAAPYRPKPAGPKPGKGRKPDPRLQQKDENELRINEEITAPQVRLVGDNIPEQGIYSIAKAMQIADELELDLVEISAKADPPVCKILDYQKYLYQQRKKAKEMKSNSAKIVLKEIRFGPNTDEHDFQFKLKHAREFLQEGSKVKATIFFRGRSIMFADQGEKQLLRFAVELEEFGRAENMPTLEGKRMTMIIAPLKKK
ncbi:MAG: translation initiation factor IF-3 [Bacteroidales bacterium]|nr:translation initiation factor IF-3 [Bacteroidales bacterium]